MRFTPQFAVPLRRGLPPPASCGRADRIRALPWQWIAGAAAALVLVLIGVAGAPWTVAHYFWVDMALAPAVCALLAAR